MLFNLVEKGEIILKIEYLNAYAAFFNSHVDKHKRFMK